LGPFGRRPLSNFADATAAASVADVVQAGMASGFPRCA